MQNILEKINARIALAPKAVWRLDNCDKNYLEFVVFSNERRSYDDVLLLIMTTYDKSGYILTAKVKHTKDSFKMVSTSGIGYRAMIDVVEELVDNMNTYLIQI